MKDLQMYGSFKKDLKRITKSGWDRTEVDVIVAMLRADEPLPLRVQPHKLTGGREGFWECHIQPDWLLIYDFTDTKVLLVETGTHADLFE